MVSIPLSWSLGAVGLSSDLPLRCRSLRRRDMGGLGQLQGDRASGTGSTDDGWNRDFLMAADALKDAGIVAHFRKYQAKSTTRSHS